MRVGASVDLGVFLAWRRRVEQNDCVRLAAWFLSVIENVCFRLGNETPCRMTRAPWTNIRVQLCARQSDGPDAFGPLYDSSVIAVRSGRPVFIDRGR